MALGRHTKNPSSGRIRRERGDSLVKNLKKEYPEFAHINGHTKLETLRREFGVDSLNEVRKALRKSK